MKTNQKKITKKKFKLITFEHQALKDTLNYKIICKKCSPTSMCLRHGHIAFCSDHGPKPNPYAKVTKNGPTRICQRIFRQNFKNEVYLHPKKDFLDIKFYYKKYCGKDSEFHDLTFEDQMSKLEFYCTEFGLYTSDQEASDYGKLPEPSLSEVQEVQSASFLSFREILNY